MMTVVSRARRSRHAEGRAARRKGGKERLVTLDRFLWTSPECWRYQSDWRAFNNYIYLPYCSHDPHRLKREQEQICELDGHRVASEQHEQHATRSPTLKLRRKAAQTLPSS